jgi:Ser/Thr protein kinase RdoA (MazF antagonist)
VIVTTQYLPMDAKKEIRMPVPADPGPNMLLVTTAPQATDEDAIAIAVHSFGVVAKARFLTSERDKNFHIQADDGREFVLKITNSAEDPGVTNLQTEALRHIERHAPHLPAPRACPTLDGRFEAVVTLGNASDHIGSRNTR